VAQYVGETGNLKGRLRQHLVLRDSSVATGTSPVGLNPEYVTEVRWWTLPSFTDVKLRGAAELIAFEQLNPVLRSKSIPRKEAVGFLDQAGFRTEMEELFRGAPSGRLRIPTLLDALRRITALEEELARLRTQLAGSPP
jgi:hypothetical protein